MSVGAAVLALSLPGIVAAQATAWLAAEGKARIAERGADCPFKESESLGVAAVWPGNQPESGVLRIDDRFVYLFDELGPAAQRTVQPDPAGLRIGGTFALPRRDCVIDVEPAVLQTIERERVAEGLRPFVMSGERALALYRQIRSARRGNRDDLQAADAVLTDLSTLLGDASPLVSVSALRVGELFFARGDYAHAIPLFERAWKGFAAAQGEDDLETLGAFDRLVWNLRERKAGPELVTMAERARELSTARWGERHPHTLRTRHTLAAMLSTSGDIRRAIEEGRRAYAMRRDVLGPEHLDTLRSLNNLAVDYRTVGQLRQALEYQRVLYEAVQRAQGPDDMLTLIVGNNLALLYDDLGDTAAAVSLLDSIYLRRLASVGPDHPETARTLNSIGTVLARSGRFEESVDVFRRAVEIRRATQGPDHPLTLNTMSNLASSLVQLGRNAEAADLQRQVVAGLDRARVPDGDITFAARQNYISTLLDAGRIDEAHAVAQESVARALERFPPTKSTVLDLRIVAADAQWRAGAVDDGLQALKAALGDARSTYGDEHPVTLSAFDVAARALARSGRTEEAAALLEQAVAAVERARSSSLLTPEYRQGLATRWRPHYANLADFRVRAGSVTQAFAVSEQTKARGLLESIARNRGLASGVLPPEHAQELREYEVRLSRLEERIAESAGDVARRTAMEAERNDLLRAERSLRAELGRRFPKFAQLSEPRVVDARAGASAVGPQAVFVSYVLADQTIIAFTLDARGRLQAKRLARPADFEARIEALRLLLAAPSGHPDTQRPWRLSDGRIAVSVTRPAPDATPFDDLDALAADLGAVLLEPLRAELKRAQRWIVSPDSVLALLPFEVLRFGGRSAVEQAEISYVQSLSVLAEIRARKRRYPTLRRDIPLLAFGDPAYETTAPVADASSRGPLLRSSASSRGGPFTRLPASERELRLVAGQFGRADVRLYRGVDASEPALKALNATGQLGRFRYLLFSAHGVIQDDAPSLSAIVLAQDRPESIEDGFVTVAEWPQYDLHADLVVLSACDTARGKVVTGEGVLGLPYALFVAGSAESLLTLWKIEDRSAAEFSGRVFRHLRAGASPARAVTLAKREMLRDAKYARPFFWAPYVVYGG